MNRRPVEAGGPCLHCRAAVVREAAVNGGQPGAWLHTSLEPRCRTEWGELLPSMAAGLTLRERQKQILASQSRAGRFHPRRPAQQSSPRVRVVRP